MRRSRFICCIMVIGWVGVCPVAIGQVATSLSGRPGIIPISADGVQRATVIVDSYSFSPNHLVVEAGKPVELTLVSVVTIIPHNFLIRDLAAGLIVEQDVGPGKTVTVRFTASQPGIFPFFCDKRLWPLPSHREKGMEGVLEVTAE